MLASGIVAILHRTPSRGDKDEYATIFFRRQGDSRPILPSAPQFTLGYQQRSPFCQPAACFGARTSGASDSQKPTTSAKTVSRSTSLVTE